MLTAFRQPRGPPCTPRELGGREEQQDAEPDPQDTPRRDVSDQGARDRRERRQRADQGSVAPADLGRLAPGAEERDGDDGEERRRLGVELAQAEHERERGHEEDAAADAEEAGQGARPDAATDDREPLEDREGTIRSMATATSRAANA